MPLAPITGRLRKRLLLDLSCAFGLGISSAYAYWSVHDIAACSFTHLRRARYGYHLKYSTTLITPSYNHLHRVLIFLSSQSNAKKNFISSSRG